MHGLSKQEVKGLYCCEAASGGVWRERRREGGTRGRQAEETVNTERINFASE